MKLHELQARLKQIAAEMREMHEKIGESIWDESQQREWDERQAEYDATKGQIDREIALREKDADFVDDILDDAEKRAGNIDPEDTETLADEMVFRSFLRYGKENMTSEEKRHLAKMNKKFVNESRAQGVADDTKGGYAVPREFWNKVVDAMKAYGGIANHCQVLTTSHGRPIDWVTSDGTNDMGAYVAENTAVTEQEMTIGQVSLTAVKLTSNLIHISSELLQDAEVDIEGLIARRIASRIARKEAMELVRADGSTINGVVTPVGLAGSVTNDATAGAAAAISYEDFIELKHAVDPAYRAGAKFAFNDNTFKAAKLLKDGMNRPLWLPAIAGTAPATIDGDAYFIDQGIHDMATGNKSAYYGDWDQFILRRVSGMTLRRLEERYAEFDQTAFLAFMRFGCVLQDMAALKGLVHPA